MSWWWWWWAAWEPRSLKRVTLTSTVTVTSAAPPTVERDGAVRVSERVLGDTSVLGDVRSRDVADVELHVDLVPGVHRHDLVLVVCNTRGEAAAVLQCCSAAVLLTGLQHGALAVDPVVDALGEGLRVALHGDAGLAQVHRLALARDPEHRGN